MEPQPTKTDIEAVFHRLRAIPTNKTCFDCNAKNPSWSSVTYGVFICLDCSAVHRSLGVHLTFVRSTQLDTNWTWIQLRQMQLGGNSNALQFFQQHNCNTTDAQKKYNSRAAQLYREKLQQAALQSLKNNTQYETIYSGFFLQENQQLHIHPMADEKADNAEKEVDFFSEHENFTSPELPDLPEQHLSKSTIQNPEEGPKVDFSVGNSAEPRKSTITTRKPPAKKLGLGAKKGGLGATKVKTNFAELEKEAELAEQSRLRAQEESARAAELSVKEQEEREAAVRLAYKDLSKEVQKKEEQVRKQDPRKAEQVERLGMGINSRAGVSHSAISDMQVIEQENQQSMPSTLSSLGKLRISDIDNFFDEYAFYDKMVRNPSGSSGSFTSGKTDSILAEVSASNSSRDNWVIIDDPPEKPRSTYKSYDKPRVVDKSPSSGESAQQKFGNAKAISSDQYFNNQETDYETKANLNRFQGSSSISSAEFFGNGSSTPQSYNNLQQYDLDDVKESVRQGVTKVAGKIGSLANGFMSSLQERYGY